MAGRDKIELRTGEHAVKVQILAKDGKKVRFLFPEALRVFDLSPEGARAVAGHLLEAAEKCDGKVAQVYRGPLIL